MKPSEIISDMYIRFTQIVTSLHALGRELTNYEKVNKILRCLPVFFDAKITTITESKDLNIYYVDNLIGSLITYEQGMNQRNLDACDRKKEKIIALKTHDSETDSPSHSDDDDIALITRQFKKFLRKKHMHHQKWNKSKRNKNPKVSSDVIYFECKKPEHVKAYCPILKAHPNKEKGEEKPKFKNDKRIQKAFWVDITSDSSETEVEEETINLYLMAGDDLH